MNEKTAIHPLATDLDLVLERTEKLWEDFRGEHLFVTGGTGFFGKWLLESFTWANDRLKLKAHATVLTRNYAAFSARAPRLAAHEAISFHIGDVRDFDFPKGKFSFFIHGATESDTQLNSQNPLLMFDTVTRGTKRVLDFAVRSGARHFLLTSSGAVYGTHTTRSHIKEDDHDTLELLKPGVAYAEGKRVSEMLCAIFAQKHGLQTKIARCFSFVGPYLPLDMHYAIGNFIGDVINSRPIVVRGDGSPYRSYMYGADLVIWLWTILLHGKKCRAYNVGSDQAVTIQEAAQIVAKCCKPSLPVIIMQEPHLSGKPDFYVPSTKRAREECGLRQIIDFEEGIKRTIGYFTNKPGPTSRT